MRLIPSKEMTMGQKVLPSPWIILPRVMGRKVNREPHSTICRYSLLRAKVSGVQPKTISKSSI